MADDDVLGHAPATLRGVGAAAGGLSLLGSFIIIAVFGPHMRKLYEGPSKSTSHHEKIKALRGGYQFTLLWLSIADAVVGVAWFTSAFAAPDDSSFCVAQGFFIEFGVVASAMWTACLCYELFRFTVKLDAEVRGNFALRRYKIYMCGSWGVAAVSACVAAFQGDFANAGGWCWLVNRFDLLQFLVGYIPLFGVLLFLVVTYTRIAVWIHRKFKDRLGWRGECTKLAKLSTFPAVFFIIWFIPMIARFTHPGYDANHPAAGPIPLITAFFLPSQGWANALVYTLMNKSVATQVLTKLGCARCCGDAGSRRKKSTATTASSATSVTGHSGINTWSPATSHSGVYTAMNDVDDGQRQ